MPTQQPAGSTTSQPGVLGRQEPRIWTPPLRDLDDPQATYGYDLIEFADLIGWPLDPWQQWCAVHMGELLPDGRPRFRMVLILLARQNGKTLLARVLVLYWMFVERVPLVLGTSTSRDTAKESWREVVKMAESNDVLSAAIEPLHTRETIGEEAFYNVYGSRYRFAAPNRRAGRSLTVHRTVLDELREHRVWDTYNASLHAMNAVRDAQAVAISNQGDANSVVLDSIRDSALEFIETGRGDSRTMLAEWSSPNGSDVTNLDALAHANPSLGGRIDPDALLGMAIRAQRNGGEELASFKTEACCMRVGLLNAAIDPDAWQAAGTDSPLDLAAHRARTAVCVDVALDGSHATAVAAATIGGVTHVEVVGAWNGYGCTAALRREFPALVERIRPKQVGWFPNGPAAAVAAQLRARNGSRSWAPRRTEVAELTTEVPAVCMGLAEQVATGEVRHPKDPMLTTHVDQTQKLNRGDGWVFTRRGSAPIDGTYALAGAVHLARTMPPPPPPLAVVR